MTTTDPRPLEANGTRSGAHPHVATHPMRLERTQDYVKAGAGGIDVCAYIDPGSGALIVDIDRPDAEPLDLAVTVNDTYLLDTRPEPGGRVLTPSGARWRAARLSLDRDAARLAGRPGVARARVGPA